MSLRYKFFAAFLFVGIVSFLLLGFGVYHYSVQIFYENFVDYHFNLTKNIAASISGEEHSQFKEESSIKLKSFQHYFYYLRKLHSNEQHVTYLYTLNYNSEKNEFQYAVDPYEIKTDTVWIETPYFGLEVFSNENGEIVLKYNSELYTENFQIEFENKTIPFRFERKQYLRTVYVFDNIKLIEYSNFPKPIWFTPKGIIQYDESHEVEANFEDQNFKITYFLSQKGSFSSLPGGEYQDSFNMTSTIRETFFKGSAFIFPEPVPMAYGKFLVAFATILDSQSRPSGVVLLEISDKVVRSYKRKIEYIFFSIFAVIALFSILLAFLFAKYLTNPIYALSSAAKEIAKGNMETTVDISRRDELGELATSFNHMAKSLAEAYTELRATNKAYSRFVPIEFLQLLGRRSILEVKLGDQVRKEMTVLFADIWSFTTISEKMTPEENFEFINGFLERMSPIIRMNHGVIDKYIGDCIMALFPKSPLDAIKAATEMLESLKSYNAQRKKKNEFPIRIGIGIHTGTLMLGTIGERERMESTVISDVVNVASRIEGLTRRFESEIIISEDSIKWIPEIHDIYKMRYLGKVEVKGKTELIPIYEPISLADNLKAQTKEEFEIAVFQYEFGNFSSAKLGFEKILSLNPNDGAVKYYLSKIDSHLSKSELEPIQNIIV
ncbi:MAG: HAMP domain-containing protein [Leptospiraceae bacterium]|nr:HAMP domain-containing protein [Leptospiraceae bacterium]